jgi:thioredoxin 1
MTNEMLEHPGKTAQRRVPNAEIQTATGSTFSALVLQAKRPIVVEFMSYGCAHCRVIEPVLEQVAEMLKTKETIFRINTAVDQQLADTYEIRGTPTLIMFRNGNEVGRAEGPHPTLSSVLRIVTEPFES